MARSLHQPASARPLGKSLSIPLPRHPPLDGFRHLVERGRWRGRRRGRRRGHREVGGMRLVLHRHSGDLGFSLIELMVVIVLIGIMAAIIVPELKCTYEEALL